jgi:hypothetical protein
MASSTRSSTSCAPSCSTSIETTMSGTKTFCRLLYVHVHGALRRALPGAQHRYVHPTNPKWNGVSPPPLQGQNGNMTLYTAEMLNTPKPRIAVHARYREHVCMYYMTCIFKPRESVPLTSSPTGSVHSNRQVFILSQRAAEGGHLL